MKKSEMGKGVILFIVIGLVIVCLILFSLVANFFLKKYNFLASELHPILCTDMEKCLMKIENDYLSGKQVNEEEIFYFPNGIIGFENFKKFVLVDTPT